MLYSTLSSVIKFSSSSNLRVQALINALYAVFIVLIGNSQAVQALPLAVEACCRTDPHGFSAAKSANYATLGAAAKYRFQKDLRCWLRCLVPFKQAPGDQGISQTFLPIHGGWGGAAVTQPLLHLVVGASGLLFSCIFCQRQRVDFRLHICH